MHMCCETPALTGVCRDGVLPDQATSYLVTAWEALAAQREKKMHELPVVFEDVRILQAVPAAPGASVALSVLLDASQRFQVCAGPPCDGF
jgi:fatty acid synthase